MNTYIFNKLQDVINDIDGSISYEIQSFLGDALYYANFLSQRKIPFIFKDEEEDFKKKEESFRRAVKNLTFEVNQLEEAMDLALTIVDLMLKKK